MRHQKALCAFSSQGQRITEERSLKAELGRLMPRRIGLFTSPICLAEVLRQ